MTPRVSICIPAHNEGPRLGTLLGDLLPQAPPDAELLICPNGCTDDTEAVARAAARGDPRVRVLTCALGKNLAWNTLVDHARAPLWIFVDADLRLKAGAITALLEAEARAPERVACISGIDVPRSDIPWLPRLLSTPLGFDYVYGGLCLFRREALGAALGTTALPTHVVAEDLWLQIVLGADRYTVEPGAVAYFDPGSVHNVLVRMVRADVGRQQARHEAPLAYAAYAATLPARGGLAALGARLRSPMPSGLRKNGVAGTALRLVARRLWRREIRRLRQRMNADIRAGRGGDVLATSGRIHKR